MAVPREMTKAHKSITGHGTAKRLIKPPLNSANVIIPIDFCASAVPCAKATNAAEIAWPRRNILLSLKRLPWRAKRTSAISPKNPRTSPATGESTRAKTTALKPLTLTAPNPACASVAPTRPPINACVEEEGILKRHVKKDQPTEPNKPASSVSISICSELTSCLPIVSATLVETNAPSKLQTAARITAVFNESARVETQVATAFAESLIPLK